MIQDSFYADYILEREGSKILENDSGFVTYKINKEECFIVDFFIAKSFRKTGAARTLLTMLEKIAVANQCEILTANIYLNARGSEITLPAAIATGFKVVRSEHNVLLISKELKNGR
jgi:hypothetical protein